MHMNDFVYQNLIQSLPPLLSEMKTHPLNKLFEKVPQRQSHLRIPTYGEYPCGYSIHFELILSLMPSESVIIDTYTSSPQCFGLGSRNPFCT